MNIPRRLHKLSEARRELEGANRLAEKNIADVEDALRHASRLLLLIDEDLDHLHKHSRWKCASHIHRSWQG